MLEAKLNILFSEYYLLILFLIFLGNQKNWEKQRRKYRKANALRKKHKIVLMKVKGLKANELHLKLQREKKGASNTYE